MQEYRWQQGTVATVVVTAAVATMTGMIYYLRLEQSPASLPLLYLLVVTLAALLLGRLSAILAAVEAFLALNYFFVEPRYRFTVQQPAEWLALCVFLLTALIVSQLLAMERARAEEAQHSKQETDALAEASWAIASEPDRDRALSKVLHQLFSIVPLKSAELIIVDEDGQRQAVEWHAAERGDSFSDRTSAISELVNTVIEERRAIGWESGSRDNKELPPKLEPATVYLPVTMEGSVLGVLYLDPTEGPEFSPTQRRVISSLLNHAAVVIQRHRLMKLEAKAQALVEADLLKTALLSMITHDFRSPLTSIKASVGTLLQEDVLSDAETQLALLEGIDRETDRLNRLVGNVLDLSRLEAGAWRPKCEMIPLAELIGSTLDSFDAEENARIQLQLDAAVTEVWLDFVQIVQVLRNLLENALKYSPAAQPVQLNAFREGDAMIFEVVDRGPGLLQGTETSVFEPFYRAPHVSEGALPGIGIGLTICRGLVEAHGGTIAAQNHEGGGAQFRVALPLGPREQ